MVGWESLHGVWGLGTHGPKLIKLLVMVHRFAKAPSTRYVRTSENNEGRLYGRTGGLRGRDAAREGYLRFNGRQRAAGATEH